MTQQIRGSNTNPFFYFIKKKNETDIKTSSETNHYLNYIDKYQKTGKKINWNWSAFFFTFQWMFYRKMYLTGFFYLNLFLFSSILFFYTVPLNNVQMVLFFFIPAIFYVMIGMFGDFIYYNNIIKKVKDTAEQKRVKNTDFITFFLSFISIPFCLISAVIISITDKLKRKIHRLAVAFFLLILSSFFLGNYFVEVVFDESPLLQKMVLYGDSKGRRVLRGIGIPAKIAQDVISVAYGSSIANLAKNISFINK